MLALNLHPDDFCQKSLMTFSSFVVRNQVWYSIIHLTTPFLTHSFLVKETFPEAISLHLLSIALAGLWLSEGRQRAGRTLGMGHCMGLCSRFSSELFPLAV